MEEGGQEVTTHNNVDSEDTALPTVSSPTMRKIMLEKKVPPLRITVPKFKLDPPKLKCEVPRPPSHSPKSPCDFARTDKPKSKGESAMKSGALSRGDSHPPTSVDVKAGAKPPQLPLRPPSRDSLASDVSRTKSPSSMSTTSSGTASAAKKEQPAKTSSVAGVSHHQQSAATVKTDFGSKPTRTDVSDPRGYSKPETTAAARTVKPEAGDRGTAWPEAAEARAARLEAVDSRRKYGSGGSAGSRDFTSATPGWESSRESVFSLFGSPPGGSSAREPPGVGREPLPSSGSRDTSGFYSGYGSGRDTTTSSLYPSAVRDSSTLGRGSGLSSASASPVSASFRDSLLGSGPGRDLPFGSGSGRDIHLGSGYIHLSSGSSRDGGSLFGSPSGRGGDSSHYPRGGAGDPKNASTPATSRHGLSTSISGKENADRPLGVKSLTSVPKKGDGVQPLDTILNSSLYAGDSDKSKQYKGQYI